MLVTVSKYIEIVRDFEPFVRTLGAAVVSRDATGHPLFVVGNRSVVFRIEMGGRSFALKCYTAPKPNIRRIYGSRCLHDELYIPEGVCGGRYVDVVVCEWVEGRTLRCAVAEAAAAGDAEAFGRLSAGFDLFAAELLEAEWAHGDLKPDNIIVCGDGSMRAVDFDSVYRPDLADMKCDESGTAMFQHPQRSCATYNAFMDDYPAALISTALRALSLDVSLAARCSTDEMLLFDPRECVEGRSELLAEVETLFSARGDDHALRMARRLRSQSMRLTGIAELMRLKTAVKRAPTAPESAETPSPCPSDCTGNQGVLQVVSQGVLMDCICK